MAKPRYRNSSQTPAVIASAKARARRAQGISARSPRASADKNIFGLGRARDESKVFGGCSFSWARRSVTDRVVGRIEERCTVGLSSSVWKGQGEAFPRYNHGQSCLSFRAQNLGPMRSALLSGLAEWAKCTVRRTRGSTAPWP